MVQWLLPDLWALILVTAVNQNIGLLPSKPYVAGNDLEVDVTCRDEAGVLLDLAGASATWVVCPFPDWKLRDAEPEEEVVIRYSVGSGLSIQPGSILRIAISKLDTDDLAGMHHHELEVTLANGNTYTVMTGRWLITQQRVR